MKELVGKEKQHFLEKAKKYLSDLQILGGARYSDAIVSDDSFSVYEYQNDERIFSRKDYKKALSFILSGQATAKKHSAGNDVVIRTFVEGELFGIAALFGESEEYVSEIISLGHTVVAFIPQDIVSNVFRACPDAAIAYISLLSQKIRYLNRKIDSFSAPSAMAKLCLYLLENNSVSLSMQALSERLGVTRMTLYRNLNQLVQNGSVTKEGKVITVLDRDQLASIAEADEIF